MWSLPGFPLEVILRKLPKPVLAYPVESCLARLRKSIKNAWRCGPDTCCDAAVIFNIISISCQV